MSIISAHNARQKLSELLELAYYKDERIQVRRNNKPMAWIVGEPFMDAIHHLLDHIMTHQPELADSLAISLDADIRRTIEASRQETAAGQVFPLASILDAD